MLPVNRRIEKTVKRVPSSGACQAEAVGGEDQHGRIGAKPKIYNKPVATLFRVGIERADDVEDKRNIAVIAPAAEHARHTRKRLGNRFVPSDAGAEPGLVPWPLRRKIGAVQLC